MIFRFEDCELDTDRHELKKEGEPVSMEPQVLAVLTFLLEQRHRVVSKDDLIAEVWHGRFVSDAAMSSRVKAARQAIGDDGRAQRLIKTIHGTGYRFVGALEETAAAQVADSRQQPPTVAVLPLINLSGDEEQNYFANAVTQDLANAISRHRWISVVARNALRAYEKQDDVLHLVRTHLGVDYLVEGSVRKAGNRIRVTAQLTETESGRNRWTETYDRDLEDVFAVQDKIVSTIVARIEPEIGFAERRRVVEHSPRNLRSWDCFHLGVDHFFKFTAQDNKRAQELLQQSRELDPKFGEAHAWWAYSLVLGMVYWDVDASQEQLDAALAATSTALNLDDRNAVFYALKARVQLARKEYDSAIAENELAIELNPTLASAHCGLADSLAYAGRYDEAIARFEHVIELSTNDPQRWAFFTYGALTLLFKGDYARAVEWCDRALEIPNRQYWTLAHKMVALSFLDRVEEAHAVKAQLLTEKPEFSRDFAAAKLFYLKDEQQKSTYLAGLSACGL